MKQAILVFNSKINKLHNSCWVWISYKNSYGYGVFKFGGKTHMAHRFSYEQKNGKISGGLFCLHKCDNPSCVNPDHLFLGAQKDNVRDCINKGRFATGEKTNNSKLKAGQIIEIKKLWKSGLSKTKIASLFGVSIAAISLITTNKRWRHIKS